ncbi:winged helix-turn-helix transcriptional regulator [Haladaptatus sp. F3-133]|jgi:DNA-binding HxlR family transcriptional regulator|uniref:Winged helix-turn-helix transcriptional regulator n=1 Tax=Halorutilus salinus TaxID=2487751 RepID=A0A9Q4GK44_9EURY|nr:winged helix-turn-helix transcriptional regulator [Halorutilus salinus]MCX2819831.1 winged helix-turn-helix transcriptional regulator [Halorutilus salinus]
MPESESISDFLQKRGALGILTLLSTADGRRFKDLDEQLTISSSTLTLRLTEARGLGLVVPGMDTDETSVNNEYRITTRGKRVARRMESQGLIHAVRTILDYQQDVESELPDLLDWVEAHKEELARLDDQTPYQDPFGESVVDTGDDPEYDDERMIKEDFGRVEQWGTEPDGEEDEVGE